MLPAVARGGAGARGGIWEFEIVGRIWRFFTSVRLALVLILILTAAILVGTLLDQIPPSVLSDSSQHAQWLERARTKYGVWTNVFDFLGLFNIFHGLWFRALIGLLTVNIIVCTLNRWKGIWATVFPPRVRMSDTFFQHARYNATFAAPMTLPVAAERVKRSLRRSRYRVRIEGDDDSVAIYADRNRFSRFGTYLAHLSLVMILAGTVVGGMWGFSDSEFVVAEGATRTLGLGTNISVGLEHFTDEYYLEGPPKDFRSEIIIYEGGKEVKRGTTRVNSPVKYKGIRFHQAFFGQAAVMEVKDAAGAELFSAALPLAWETSEGGRPVGSFDLQDQGMTVYVIGPRSGENDPLVPAGEMRVEVYKRDGGTLITADNLSQGTAKQVAGLDFTFSRESRFTGLKVVKDPGTNIIWVASALMVIGLVMLFYFPHRRLWALVKRRDDGTAEVRVGMTAQRDMSLESEFGRLRERIASALRGTKGGRTSAQGDNDV
ncbi:MAG: cytochrome c biogenesis protein ResB [Dehalococcoidia bacterium]|nr:cytochrome c biogenesis protein ResB [Dehalococcoidia bacterium]